MPETRNGESASFADRLLEEARSNRWPLSLYLVSGFQLKGEVVEFDMATVLFKRKDIHQLVMRSAIATMYPVPGLKADADAWWRAYASDTTEQ